MTRSNRVLNRIILALIGVLLIAAAAAALVAVAGWMPDLTTTVRRTLTTALAQPVTLWLVAAGCLVLIVLALAWMTTRGRGHASELVRVTSADGAVGFDRRYLEDALTSFLIGQRDVTGVSVAAYRAGRRQIGKLTVTVKRGSDIVAVTAAVRSALERLDAELGVTVPLVTHLAPGPFARSGRAA